MEKETKKKKTTNNKKSTATKKTAKKVVSKTTTKKNVEKKNDKNKEVKTLQVEQKKETVKKDSVKPKIVENKKVKEKKKTEVKSVVEKKKFDIKAFVNSEIGALTILVLIITLIVAIFLLITNVINSRIQSDNNLVTSNDIQYDEILVGNILNQKNSVYYVLVYDESDNYFESYNMYMSSYNAKDDSIRFYTSRLNLGFNKPYYNEEESNVVGSSLEDLKFKGTTLIKVENGKIVEAYEEPSAIIEHFKSIKG